MGCAGLLDYYILDCHAVHFVGTSGFYFPDFPENAHQVFLPVMREPDAALGDPIYLSIAPVVIVTKP